MRSGSTRSKPQRKRSPGGDDCSRDRPVRSSGTASVRHKSDETNFSDLRREILGTFGGSDEHGTKGGFGGFAASCERESPIRPDHWQWLPGAYSQKLGGKFAQRFCDATLKCRPHPPHDSVLCAAAVVAPRNTRSPKALPVREPLGSMWHDPQQLQHVHPEALGSPSGYVVPTGHRLLRPHPSL